MHQCITFILFWNDTLHVSDGLSVHHQEFKTVHMATGICRTDTAVCLLAGTCTILSIVKATRCINVSNIFYFGITLYVSDGLSVHYQEFKTAYSNQTDTAVCLLAGTR